MSNRISLNAVPARAFSIQAFCRQYGVGRTKVYQEIKAGKLKAKKAGKRTLIQGDEAERWARELPELHTSVMPPSGE
jgi:excisionase family DNA binding protein